MRIIIAGGRNFKDYELLKHECDKIISTYNIKNPEIISGNAKGADLLGEKYADENNLTVHHFLPNWFKYGRSAGIRRNKQMAENSDMLIAFWDGKSKGTKNMINQAELVGLIIHVVEF